MMMMMSRNNAIGEVTYASDCSLLTYKTATAEVKYRVFQIYGQKHVKRIDCFYEPELDAEIYVSNLPRNIPFEDIFRFFISCGEIYHMRLLMDFSGTNRGKCFIQFVTVLSSRQAICCLNDEVINDNFHYKVCVRMSLNNDQLLLKSIPTWVPEDVLREVLDKQIGEGLREVILKQSRYQHMKKICYCKYDSHQNAVKAHKKAWPYINLLGLMVDVHWAIPELVRKACNLYFTNYPPNITKVEFFEIAASILNMKTVVQIGYRNGFGHITFNNHWNMRRAIPSLEQLSIKGYRLKFSEEPFKTNEKISIIQGYSHDDHSSSSAVHLAPDPSPATLPSQMLLPQQNRWIPLVSIHHPHHQQPHQMPVHHSMIQHTFLPPPPHCQQIIQPMIPHTHQFSYPNCQMMMRSPLFMHQQHHLPLTEPPMKLPRIV